MLDYTTVLVLLTVCSVFSQNNNLPKPLTPMNPSLANLQTGNFLVNYFEGATRYLSFNVTLQQLIPNYRLSLSVHNISFYVPSSKIDFALSALPYQSWFEGQTVMDIEAKWQSISICYIVSAREDFIVGNFIVDNNQLIDPAFNDSQVTMSQYISVDYSLHSNHYFAMTFISGLRTYENSLSASFKSTSFNSSSQMLNFTIKMHYQQFPIQFMSISYLIFHMKELDISRVRSILALPKDQNIFLGISDVMISPQLFSNNVDGFGSDESGRLLSTPVQMQAFFEMFGVHGIMVQTQRSLGFQYGAMTIAPTANSSTPMSQRKRCQSQNSQFIYIQIDIYDIQSSCLKCPQNSKINPLTGKCQCLPGLQMANKTCLRIAICFRGFIYDANTNSCLCPKGFVNLNWNCVPCGRNQIIKGDKCVCMKGFVRIQGFCGQCGDNAKYDEGSQLCQCREGYEGNGLTCTTATSSGQNDNILDSIITSQLYTPPQQLQSSSQTGNNNQLSQLSEANSPTREESNNLQQNGGMISLESILLTNP